MKRTKLHAVEMVRRIRDQQAEKMADRSPEDIIAFFRRAGKASLQAVSGRRQRKVG
jgi:hypothetical protein